MSTPPAYYLRRAEPGPDGAQQRGVDGHYYYDGKNRQIASVTGNGQSYQLAYDAFGRCVKRTLNGETKYYTYDGHSPIYEWNAAGARAGWNVYGKGVDEILLRAEYVTHENGQGQGFFFQQDRLGSVTHLTNFIGDAIEIYRYDAFGQPTTTYNAGGIFDNRFKFTGREWSELGKPRHRREGPEAERAGANESIC